MDIGLINRKAKCNRKKKIVGHLPTEEELRTEPPATRRMAKVAKRKVKVDSVEDQSMMSLESASNVE